MPVRAVHASALVLTLALASETTLATPEFIEHIPQTQVFGESPSTRMRFPGNTAPSTPINIWIRIGYAFFYTDVAIYYTTDGTNPAGSFGTPSGSTSVLRNPAGVTFIRNESSGGGNIDWWRGTIPGQPLNTIVKYRIGAWHSGGGPEVFTNNYNCSDGTCDQPSGRSEIHAYKVSVTNGPIGWPGGGHGSGHETTGYPNIHFWMEEAVVGNNYMNVMLDQNGTFYDVYFPGAGCTQGIATKNEGYADGIDTFPPGTSGRGQMHVNQALAGLTFSGNPGTPGVCWLSNEGGAYDSHAQSYVADTNVVSTSSRLFINGLNCTVQQYDFCPKGITFPTDNGGAPSRFIHIKRFIITNNTDTGRGGAFYYNSDSALNGGDGFDFMFADIPRGTMVAYDNIQRNAGAAGEYNPTFGQGDYNKNVSVYLATAVKICSSVGSAAGTPALESWRNSSSDHSAGWVASLISIGAGQSIEIDVAAIGGYDNFPNASGTYDYQIAPVIDWFHTTSMADIQTATENDWTNWLASGTTIDTPDDTYDALFNRSLLATALHLDAKGGGVVAGMHNGAYPFVWPRDALYAAVTLDRTGHTAEAAEVYRFLRDVAFRDEEEPGRKGWWYQKYTTDGYKVWTSPQVDETANVTWGGYFHYLVTGDLGFLDDYYPMFYEAGRAMSEDSNLSSQMRYEESVGLMFSNNVWEDSFDTFVYSNATVVRGLRDLVKIAQALDQDVCPGGPGTCGYDEDVTLFNSRANAIQAGLDARLDWDGENTDISQLGCVWPFETHSPTDPRMAHVVDRMNGVAVDRFGNNRPIVNFAGEFQDLINRYFGDTYWNGGPWFLSTMWYGQYYAKRQDYNPGKADIDKHKHRIDRANDFLGPVGLGAEQMAPSNSLLYPDFRLQAAWPNAWESMSFYVDSLMLFLDHKPDAKNNTLYLAPKLPTGWISATFKNVTLGSARVNITAMETLTGSGQNFTNLAGTALNVDTWIRLPADAVVTSVVKDNSPVPYTLDTAAGRVHVITSLNPGVSASTVIGVTFNDVRGDFNHDGRVDETDFDMWQACATRDKVPQTNLACLDGAGITVLSDLDADTDVDMRDYALFQRCYSGNALANPACDD